MTSSSSEMHADDIELIKQHGVPFHINPEFVLVEGDGSLKFSDRGRNVYRLACLMSGLSPDEELEGVRDVEGLRALSLRVKQVRTILNADALERAQQGGRIPVKPRVIVEAALHGTAQDLRAAVANFLTAEAAGANVIPVFLRRPRR